MNLEQNRGFTLVELLVSILIVGIAVVPMIHSFTTAWQFTLENQQTQKAIMLAEWKLNQIRAEEDFDDLSTGGDSFDLEDSEYNEFSYELVVETVEESDGDFEMKKVWLRVRYPSLRHGGTRSIRCQDIDECDVYDKITYVSNKGLPDS